MYERDTGTVEHTAADAIESITNSEVENLMTGLFLVRGRSWLKLRTTLRSYVEILKNKYAQSDKRLTFCWEVSRCKNHTADDSEHMDVYNKDIRWRVNMMAPVTKYLTLFNIIIRKVKFGQVLTEQDFTQITYWWPSFEI